MIIVCGIYGFERKQYSNNLKLKKGINAYTLNKLINQNLTSEQIEPQKINQEDFYKHDNFFRAISKNLFYNENIILNTQLCFIDENEEVKRIPIKIFQDMPITEIHLVECSVKEVKQRISEQNTILWSEALVRNLLDEERKYAIELSKSLNVPLYFVNTSVYNKKNIILPITPQYIDKILSGEKKYEYRKKLCKNNISRIYLYATAPIKGIVGEVEVIGRLMETPQDLWNLTFKQSGVDEEFFYKYFSNCSKACAYKLGRVRKYVDKIPLHNIGINYAIQSFKYMSDI